jgi:acyl dehydratase
MPDPAPPPAPPGLLKGALRSRASIAAVARLVVRGPFGRPPAEAPPVDALPAATHGPFVPDAGRLRELVAATEGALADFERPEGLLLPPTAYVTWLTPVMSRALLAARLALPAARVLHAGNEVRFARLPLASEALTVEARLASVDATPERTIIVERAVHRDGAGREAFTVDTTLYFPGAARPAKDDAARAAEKARERALAPRVPEGAREVGRFATSLAVSKAYTAISGDYNPVHISPLFARLLGFKGAFVHGYATKARVAHRLVRTLLGGDPRRLARLSVRFRRTIAIDEEAAVFVSSAGVPPEGAAPAGEGKAEVTVGRAAGEPAAVTGEVEWR